MLTPKSLDKCNVRAATADFALKLLRTGFQRSNASTDTSGTLLINVRLLS